MIIYHWHTASHVITSELGRQKLSNGTAVTSDPKTKRQNDQKVAQAGWGWRNIKSETTSQNHGYKHRSLDQGQSYAICLGGDALQGDSLLGFTRNIGGDDSSRTSVGYNFIYGVKETVGMASVVTGEMITVCALTSTMKPVTHSMGTTFTTSAPKAVCVGWNGADATGSLKYYAMSGLDASQGNLGK